MYFCPNCHRRIIPPAYLNKVNTQGKIKLDCGNCKKGHVLIKPKKKEETV